MNASADVSIVREAFAKRTGVLARKPHTDRGINNATPPLHETRINTDDFRGAVSHYLCRDV